METPKSSSEDFCKCLKIILIVILVIVISYVMYTVLSAPSKIPTSASFAAFQFPTYPKELEPSAGLKQSDFYMVPNNPAPTRTNFDIATNTVASHVNGGVYEPKVF